MSRFRAATPAGKRRTSARPASRSGSSRARPAPKRQPAKRATTRRAASTRTTRRTPPRRTTARRAPARRRTRRAWSRPRPLRAARGAFGAASWRYRFAVIAILAATVAAGYFLWLRDSSLVAVTNVDVVGVTSGDRGQIVSELTGVAEQQTTLHADPAKIEKAAAVFPTVESVSVDPNFPHGMRIEVNERPPAMLIQSGGQQVPAAADGTLLAGVRVAEGDHLPILEIGQFPAGETLHGDPLQQALILGATPEPLRPMIENIGHDDKYGVEVTLRGGIPVRFGSGSRAAEKWGAAAAVLADPKLDSFTYLDVRVPERPTAGGAADPVVSTDPTL
jgi:cell division protein FtsQ